MLLNVLRPPIRRIFRLSQTLIRGRKASVLFSATVKLQNRKSFFCSRCFEQLHTWRH